MADHRAPSATAATAAATPRAATPREPMLDAPRELLARALAPL